MKISIFFLAMLMAVLGAAETDAGWHFPLNKAVFYRYVLSQKVAWRSSGDDLAYRSDMTWEFALRATALDGPVATVQMTIIHIRATLDGPAAQVVVDSRIPESGNDPVYGHLIGLAGVTLTLTVYQPTGRVSAVAGSDQIIAAINKHHPASVPGDPPPFAAAAKQLYSSEALAVWWSQLLVQPSSEPQTVALAQPLTGNLRRTWSADHFLMSLPDGVSGLPVQLVEGTNSVAGTLKNVSGSGQLVMADGLLTKANGELAYTLALTAVTQAVEQNHQQIWTLERWAPTADALEPAGAPESGPKTPTPGVTHP